MTTADPRVLRALAFAALAAFAGLHWAALVAPSASGRILTAVALTTVAGLAVVRLPGGRAARIGLRAAAGVAVVAAALLLAGVPLRLLVPDEWDALASGIGTGLEALPGTRVPYGGPETWVRTVIVAGGVLLVAAGGLLAIRGRPLAGAVALGVLYAVPVVERDPGSPYLDGAVFAVLLAALIWADRVRREELGLAAGLLAAVTVAGLVTAPRVDASRPWLDYEHLARDLEAQRTSTFAWDHSYDALRWGRDGREVLRVRSRQPSYWKAVALESFDGRRWRRQTGLDRSGQDTEVLRDSWRAELRFEVRQLRSRQVVAAGTTFGVRGARQLVAEATPGTFETLRSPLRRGDQYRTSSYVPRPTAQRMREAGIDYPDFVRRQLAVGLPTAPGLPPVTVALAPWGSDEPTYTFHGRGLPSTDGDRELRRSPYARMYALARRQRAAAASPYDLARRISAFLQRDATYTERPAPADLPLDAFVFERREGYCQQFSGAMALLLRLAGVPARVASGFSPGELDEESGTWIVRDLDAHSWVEVYFPRIGWVAFDPTPSAAPAGGREGEAETAAAAPGDATGDDPLGRGAAEDEAGAAAPAEEDRKPVPWPVLVLLGGVACALAGGLAARRRRDPAAGGPTPELAELLRALRGSGRDPAAGLTLRAVERSLGPGRAADYVAALRARRYAAGGPEPSPLGRAALRRELAEGLDRGARLRAWLALRPTLSELRARLRRGP